jgi:hypothetical protein
MACHPHFRLKNRLSDFFGTALNRLTLAINIVGILTEFSNCPPAENPVSCCHRLKKHQQSNHNYFELKNFY